METPDCLVLADINAHHSLWHSNIPPDRRGTILADEINASSFGVLNGPSPTRLATNATSSPDVTLASASFLALASWSTETTLRSDHLPITTTLSLQPTPIMAEKRTFRNFGKADWESFTATLEQSFVASEQPATIHEGEKYFRKCILRAATLHIPSGRIPHIMPNYPSTAIRLAAERDAIRQADSSDQRLQAMNIQITELLDAHRREKWEQHVNEASFSGGTKSLWKTLKDLRDPTKTIPNNTISFGSRSATTARKAAALFNLQFTEHPTTTSKEQRKRHCAAFIK